MKRLSLYLVSIALLTAVGCKKDEEDPTEPTSGFDRSALLTELSAIISDAHSTHNANLSLLNTRANDFIATPNVGTLADLRVAWQQTLVDWQSVAPFEFGDAVTQLFESSHNSYPVDTANINSNIISGSYNLDAASNIDAIGLQAMDYLLNAQDENATIVNFTTATHAPARALYLVDLIAQLKSKSDVLTGIWQSGSQHTNDFIANNGTDVGSSMGLFLNAYIKSYEKSTRSNKLGIPAGALTFSMTPLPDHVEAFYENTNSIQYLRASIAAVRNIYRGGQGIGLDDYLIALDAHHNGQSLNQAILDQFNEIDSQLNLLQDPLSDFVVNDQQTALDVYAALQELVVLLKVDMMSALGILITYQDNDGD